jgi:hypothetical protein
MIGIVNLALQRPDTLIVRALCLRYAGYIVGRAFAFF